MKYIVIFIFFANFTFGHPLPNTIVSLNIQSNSMVMNVQLPLENFEIAYKSKINLNKSYQIADYFSKHIKIESKEHQFWKIEFLGYQIQPKEVALVGKYDEIQFQLKFIPNSNSDLRNFTIHYDAIIHEVRNNQALILVNSDWENGIHEQAQQIGIIELDVPTNTIYPLHISLEKGSTWKGFKSMITLGIKHISEGTDHLLFLLVLLLSAPMIAINKKWIADDNFKNKIVKILKIVTAFTVGHSVTLILGAITTFSPNSKPVEILIAFSILVTALHTIKPIFPEKEVIIAAGFGLIHGMAFATILKELQLDTNKLLLSLLGFNIGIELMQILAIILVMPWFILLSKYKIYKWVRIAMALFAIIASIAWITERYTEKANYIATLLENTHNFSIVFVIFLAIFCLLYTFYQKYFNSNETF